MGASVSLDNTGWPYLSGGRDKSMEWFTIYTQGLNVAGYILKTFLLQASFYWLTYQTPVTL